MKVVRAHENDQREWLTEAKICYHLGMHQIAHVGLMQVTAPFEISRVDPSGTFMLACLTGSGKILVDGKHQEIKAGQASLLPPFVANQLIGIPGQEWTFCWVRYEEGKARSPLCTSNSPVIRNFPVNSLYHAIMGLYSTCVYKENVDHRWADLIHQLVLGFAQPPQEDDRLWNLWNLVERDLSHPWSLDLLTHHACLSREQLRRLVKTQLGRSPMQHVTYLRMQRAAELLLETEGKIDSIAREVGYTTGYSLSSTFSKWTGKSPSEYRKK